MDILESAFYGEYCMDIIDSTLFTVHMDILDKGFVYSTYGHYR